jgi:hypothetical protein
MDERDRDWRDRDWRRSEQLGRGYGRAEDHRHRDKERPRWAEPRSWSEEDEGGLYEEMSRERRAYGEAEEDYGGRARSQTYQTGAIRARYSGPAPRFTPQDYTGRGYADEAGRADFGYATRQGYGGQRDWRRAEAYGERRGGWDEPRYGREAQWRDEGRGWRDREEERGRGRWDERDRAREGAGEFLQRAGERISSWFRGGEGPMRGRDEYRDEPRRYRADFGREDRWVIGGGHRGMGPKGYKRPDERINEEAHDRLTDDPWLDATDVRVEVKDGEVTLSGHVDNREAKHWAERLIEDISGVGHVQNNLRINPDAGLTGAGRGYGSSALEAEMRRNAETERAAEADPKTGQKRN